MDCRSRTNSVHLVRSLLSLPFVAEDPMRWAAAGVGSGSARSGQGWREGLFDAALARKWRRKWLKRLGMRPEMVCSRNRWTPKIWYWKHTRRCLEPWRRISPDGRGGEELARRAHLGGGGANRLEMLPQKAEMIECAPGKSFRRALRSRLLCCRRHSRYERRTLSPPLLKDAAKQVRSSVFLPRPRNCFASLVRRSCADRSPK